MLNWVPFASQYILWIIAAGILIFGFTRSFIQWVAGKRHKE